MSRRLRAAVLFPTIFRSCLLDSSLPFIAPSTATLSPALPISYQIDPTRRRVLVTGRGQLTDADFTAVRDQLASDPAFDPSWQQLLDFSEGDLSRLEAESIRQMAESSVAGPAARRAYVVARDVDFGLVRMFEILTDERKGRIRAFRDRGEAEAWLDGP